MVELLSDKIVVRGPKVDGGYSVTFEVGSYEQVNVAKLLALPTDTAYKLEVKVDDGQTE